MSSTPTRFAGAALTAPLMAPSRAVRARRDAGHASERHREVAGRPKAHQPADLSDRELRVAEQYRCLGDPLFQHETVRGYAGALLEESREMVRAHVDHGAEVQQRQLPAHVVLDETSDAPEPRPGEAWRRGPLDRPGRISRECCV